MKYLVLLLLVLSGCASQQPVNEEPLMVSAYFMGNCTPNGALLIFSNGDSRLALFNELIDVAKETLFGWIALLDVNSIGYFITGHQCDART